MTEIRQLVWEIVEVSKPGDKLSHRVDIFLLALIFANVIAVVLETEPMIGSHSERFFNGFEMFSVAIFSIEYLLRIWSCTSDPKYKDARFGRLRFATTPLAIIDLLAILPFYLSFIPLDLRFLRVVRLTRILRLAKLGRYSAALTLMGRVVRTRKEELVITTALMAALLLVASALMYYVENPSQPDSFSSILNTMWWAVATLTTVGYGDVYPVTSLGRLLASVVAILGIGFFALPIGILGSGFVEEVHNRNVELYCPHCGKKIEEYQREEAPIA